MRRVIRSGGSQRPEYLTTGHEQRHGKSGEGGTVAFLILRRILTSVVLLLVVSMITFLLESLTPGDAAQLILGQDYTPQAYAQLREELGLNDPLYLQYWHWLSGIFHGSLGISVASKASVASILSDRLPVTVSLVLLCLVVSAIVGIGLGVGGAVRGGLLGRALDALSLIGFATPNFWLGLVLATLFGVELKLLPVTGYTALDDSVWGWLKGLVLPVITLAAGSTASIAKLTRDSMLDAMSREFIRALRARGIGEPSVIMKHALRSAALPVATALGMQFINQLSGAVLVETIFALPGLGTAALDATNGHDFPILQGVVLYFTLMVVAVNLVLDLAYGWLNPRVRVR